MKKRDKVEYEKRIRIIQDWIIDDWPGVDIIREIENRWGIQSRQAKRYIAEARDRWVEDEEVEVGQKRAMKVVGLKKLKRSLKEIFKGTPAGINAVLRVDKEIIKLEGLPLAKKISIGGDKDMPPIQTVAKITHNLVVKKCDV